jgi:hypothetical protein
VWSGAGSNRRPSAFQVNRAKRYADLQKRTSLTSGTALGGRCRSKLPRGIAVLQGTSACWDKDKAQGIVYRVPHDAVRVGPGETLEHRPRHHLPEHHRTRDPAVPDFRLVTTPTSLQRKAFELLDVSHRLGVA